MNTISESTPGIGHNSSLADLPAILVEETEALKKRAEDLAASASRAVITDDESAGKGTMLIKMFIEHRKDIESARVAKVKPFLDAQRTVNNHFGMIDGLLASTDSKGKVIGGPLHEVTVKLDTYRREQEAKAAAEKRRLEEEARRQREAAEAAERARREQEERAAREAEEARRRIAAAEAEAARSKDAAAQAAAAQARAEEEARQAEARRQAMAAELEARRQQEQAEATARQAESVKATPIDTGLGVKATARTTYKAVITDWNAALKHARKVDEAAIQECVQAVYDRQVRAKVHNLPGADVVPVTSTVVR